MPLRRRRWTDTVLSGRNAAPARRQWGAVGPYNQGRAGNALSTWKLRPPRASEKSGSAASPVSVTVRGGRRHIRGWGLVIGLWALQLTRRKASNRVVWQVLAPVGTMCGGRTNLNLIFSITPLVDRKKLPAYLCLPLPPSQSRANPLKNQE